MENILRIESIWIEATFGDISEEDTRLIIELDQCAKEISQKLEKEKLEIYEIDEDLFINEFSITEKIERKREFLMLAKQAEKDCNFNEAEFFVIVSQLIELIISDLNQKNSFLSSVNFYVRGVISYLE